MSAERAANHPKLLETEEIQMVPYKTGEFMLKK